MAENVKNTTNDFLKQITCWSLPNCAVLYLKHRLKENQISFRNSPSCGQTVSSVIALQKLMDYEPMPRSFSVAQKRVNGNFYFWDLPGSVHVIGRNVKITKGAYMSLLIRKDDLNGWNLDFAFIWRIKTHTEADHQMNADMSCKEFAKARRREGPWLSRERPYFIASET